MNERIIDEFAHYDLQAVFTQLDETSMKVKTKVRMNFERIGLELVDLKFEALTLPRSTARGSSGSGLEE